MELVIETLKYYKKPENIVYSDKTNISLLKITNIGKFKNFNDEKNNMNSAIGTINYQAPEVLLGDIATHKSDVYSIGVILYILLCGYPPFDEEQTPDFFNEVIKGNLIFKSPDWDLVSNEGLINSKRLSFKNDESRSRIKNRTKRSIRTPFFF